MKIQDNSRLNKPIIKNETHPKLLIVGGQPRSGTTMLWTLCNSHPEIQLSFEFRNFSRLGKSYRFYIERLRKSWWKWDYLGQKKYRWDLFGMLRNGLFLVRYLGHLVAYRSQKIDFPVVRDILHKIFPDVIIVGDKFPPYIHKVETFAEMDGLYPAIIYRDVRDVVQSTLIQSSTKWKRKKFSQNLNSPSKIAARWVKAIDKMEKYADNLHVIRYEELVTTPEAVLIQLADYLDVDPAGFNHTLIRTTSIGKYRSVLSDDQIAEIMQIAGPTMKRLGYL